MNKELKGSLMVIIAGICWGISGVSGQYLMANGMDVNLLTSLRLLVSGIFITGIAFVTQKERLLQAIKKKHVIFGIILFSIFGLTMNQYAYLTAIYYTNAGTATVLQYLTPVLILAYVCLRNKRLPSKTELLAMIFAILGTFIIATHGQFDSLAITPKGLFWGLLAAVTYALYILIPVKLIQEWGSLIIIGLSILLGGLVFSIGTRSWQSEIHFSAGIWLALFGIIGIGIIFAYTVFLKGTTIVGAVKGSLLASVEPVASVILALIIMHEVFYPIDFLGMFLIILAVVTISIKDLLVYKKSEMKS